MDYLNELGIKVSWSMPRRFFCSLFMYLAPSLIWFFCSLLIIRHWVKARFVRIELVNLPLLEGIRLWARTKKKIGCFKHWLRHQIRLHQDDFDFSSNEASQHTSGSRKGTSNKAFERIVFTHSPTGLPKKDVTMALWSERGHRLWLCRCNLSTIRFGLKVMCNRGAQRLTYLPSIRSTTSLSHAGILRRGQTTNHCG